MIGQIILHYAPKAHPPLADKILEKLGEGGMFQISPRTFFVSGWKFDNPAAGGSQRNNI